MYLMMKWSIINISGLICQIFLWFFPSKICKHSLTSIQFITLSDNPSYDDYKNDITMLRLRTLQHDLVCNVIIWPETKNILQRFQFKISSDRTIQNHSVPIHFLGNNSWVVPIVNVTPNMTFLDISFMYLWYRYVSEPKDWKSLSQLLQTLVCWNWT